MSDFIIKNGILKKYTGTTSSVAVVPDGVTAIGDGAFSLCKNLKYVQIPSSVTCIGNSAFYICENLKHVRLSDRIARIGNEAFLGCSSLTSIALPDSVTAIGYAAFASCRRLTDITLPDGLTDISDAAFWDCINLTSITLPDGVIRIGARAFKNCSSLMSVTLPGSVTDIGKDAFSECSALANITIPDGTTNIGEQAFYNCSSLTSISIPDSVTDIGRGAFIRCSSLTSITIPDGVTSIGEQTFYGCEHLTSIVLPDSMTRIGNRAFYGCENLTDFHLPDSITSIGISVFGGAAKLTVHWPGTGTITDNTFDDVHCIIAPHFSVEQFPTAAQKRAAVCGFLWETEAFTDEAARTHYVKYAIGQRKKLLPWIFAEDCVSALTFYAEQKKITAANFDAEYMTPATEANATECIAFLLDWKNKHLSQDSMDKHLEKELTKDPFNAADMKKLWSYEVLDDDTLRLTSYKGNETDIYVPERIGKKTVTALGECVFSFRTPSGTSRPADRKTALAQIRTIVLPDGITSIGRSAFSGCNQSTVQWAGSGTIGERAFEGVSCLVLPRISFAVFTDMKSRRAAIQGFLRNTDAYTDAAVRAEYIRYAISQRKKLLPEIFAENLVSALTIYAEQKKITAANFDAEYMIPATEANATECIAFLLDWKNKHLSQDSMDKHLEKELRNQIRSDSHAG